LTKERIIKRMKRAMTLCLWKDKTSKRGFYFLSSSEKSFGSSKRSVSSSMFEEEIIEIDLELQVLPPFLMIFRWLSF
jgi:hypothetical protein